MSIHAILSIILPLLTPVIFYIFGYSSYLQSIYNRLIHLSTKSLNSIFQTVKPCIPWIWIIFLVKFLAWMQSLCIYILWIVLTGFWGWALVRTTVDIWEDEKRENEEGITGLVMIGVEKKIKVDGEAKGVVRIVVKERV